MRVVKIVAIDSGSPYLNDVKALWRANKATLGYFPDGAFVDYASMRGIVVALDPHDRCVGYLIYRRSRDQIRMVHLCVADYCRGNGIAKALVEHLKQTTKDSRGIALRCRRDFPANKLWPRVGFVAQYDAPGRSREGKDLTFWWFDHRHPDLFSTATMKRVEYKLCVIIDANVFFDLDGDPSADNEESRSLLADWMEDELELCLTDEVLNEINRNENSEERNRHRRFAEGFAFLPCQNERFEATRASLRRFFPERMSDSDESDLRQLARAIASDALFFVTRDEGLLSLSNTIYEAFKVSVIRPSHLIVHLDELGDEARYQPARLAGSDLQMRLVRGGQHRSLADRFQASTRKETKSEFQKNLCRFLANPKCFECSVVADGAGRSLALIVYNRRRSHELGVPMLRVQPSPFGTTLLRHLISRSILVSSREQRAVTRVTDRFLDKATQLALQEVGFVAVSDGWVKANPAVVLTADKLSARLSQMHCTNEQERLHFATLAGIIEEAGIDGDAQALAKVERILWPTKIVDANIPTYIIPIKACWAQDLFDEGLASQNLFGARAELALNSESVYYRASRPSGLSAPGRILWYVSHDRRYEGSGHLRACSRLDDVIVDKPKALYPRFRRLGAYDWQRVLAVAKGNVDNNLMAIRFSGTELFPNPISWYDLQQILTREDCRSQIQSPLRVPRRVFSRLYNLGTEVK
ncbi:MAG: GNAT family N-acetyltransferase [Chloroflexi bacterium]|nr:GNAT family N-acetyltransferase [Chloroflexota bacterium]